MTRTSAGNTDKRVPLSLFVWGGRWTILLALTAVALQGASGHIWIWSFMIGAAIVDLAIALTGEARLARRRNQSRLLLNELETRLDDEHVADNR